MATERYSAYGSESASLLSTGLNSLASGAFSALGTEYDNSSPRDTYAIAIISVTFPTAPTVNKTLDLYVIPSLDGSTYPDDGGSAGPSPAYYVGSFRVLANTSAQKILTKPFRIPQTKFKLVLGNSTDQALSASGHTVKIRVANRTIA